MTATGNGKSRHPKAPTPTTRPASTSTAPAVTATDDHQDHDQYHIPNGTVPSASPNGLTQTAMIAKHTSIDANMNEGGSLTLSRLSTSTLNKQVTKSMGSLSKLFGRRKRRHRNGSISASFSVNDSIAYEHELVNVNSATVEELMTLKGVNRTLASNIINHRALIGGFRKVEDLALVSGMGASKLGLIRNEICVRRPRAGADSLSKSPSMKSTTGSIESHETNGANRPVSRLNINNCTIFELMSVPGVNQALAARIVSHRERKGVGYKSVEELRSVCSSKRLSAMKGWLTVNGVNANVNVGNNGVNTSKSPSQAAAGSKCHSRTSSCSIFAASVMETSSSASRPNTSPPTPSTPPSPSPLFPGPATATQARPTSIIMTPDDLNDIFELMSIKSRRPFIAHPFQGLHDGKAAYRLAVWDMEGLSADKVRNPGVLEVIVRTVLENGFSLLIMQHVLDDDDSAPAPLKIICDELNGPRLQRVREFKSEWTRNGNGSGNGAAAAGNWRSSNNGDVGVLYNGAEIERVEVAGANGGAAAGRSFNVKTRQGQGQGHAYLLMVMPAAGNSGTTTRTGNVDDAGTQDTLIIKADASLELTGADAEEKLNDGISALFLNGMTSYATGSHGEVTQGLSHLAIPNGWNWGGRVTKSEPVWITLYSEPKSKAEAPVAPANSSVAVDVESSSKLKTDEIS